MHLRFLSVFGPPARLTVEQAAVALNCQTHDIPTLVAAKLLRPLGNPPASGVKFFATIEILELSKNACWLAKATSAIHRHWRVKNERKKSGQSPEEIS